MRKVDEQYIRASAEITCEKSVRPCCDPLGKPYDAAACVERVFKQELVIYNAPFDGIVQHYNPAYTEECLRQRAAYPAACRLGRQGAEWGLLGGRHYCYYIHDEPHGTLALGEACQRDTDCAIPPDGVVQCGPGPVGGPGPQTSVCTAIMLGVEGDRCGLTSNDAAVFDPRHFYCERERGVWCDNSACRPLLTEGEACKNGRDCADGLFCDGCLYDSTLCSGGTCRQQRPAGEPCSTPTANSCAKGTICSGDGVCVPERSAGPGEPCNEGCALGFTCGENDLCEDNDYTPTATRCGGGDSSPDVVALPLTPARSTK